MTYRFRNSNQALPVAANDIHPAWCTCSDCTLDRRRSFRLDLMIIGLGLAGGCAGAVVSWLGGF